VINATPRPLYPRVKPGTDCIGGWVGPRAGLDGWGKSLLHQDSIPRPSSLWRVAILTELYRTFVFWPVENWTLNNFVSEILWLSLVWNCKYRCALQVCPTGVPHRCAPQVCPTGVPYRCAPPSNPLIQLSAVNKFQSARQARTWWNPTAQTRPVLDSSSFVSVLTLPRRKCLHPASNVLAVRISFRVIEVFVFRTPFIWIKLYRIYVCYTNITLYIAFGIIRGLM
jgi:hypothetical protein